MAFTTESYEELPEKSYCPNDLKLDNQSDVETMTSPKVLDYLLNQFYEKVKEPDEETKKLVDEYILIISKAGNIYESQSILDQLCTKGGEGQAASDVLRALGAFLFELATRWYKAYATAKENNEENYSAKRETCLGITELSTQLGEEYGLEFWIWCDLRALQNPFVISSIEEIRSRAYQGDCHAKAMSRDLARVTYGVKFGRQPEMEINKWISERVETLVQEGNTKTNAVEQVYREMTEQGTQLTREAIRKRAHRYGKK